MNRTILLLAAALLAAAPSQAQRCTDGGTERLRPADRARLEAERQFLDSLQAEVIEGVRRAGFAEPSGLVVIDLGDRREDPELTTYTAPVVGEAVRGVLRARADRLAAWPGREGTFFLRLDPAPRPAGARECAPRLLNEARLVSEARSVLPGLSGSDPGMMSRGAPRVSVNVRMLVDREGQVVHAFLTRQSNRPAINRTILDLARRQRFEPATVDGVPVDAWVHLPFDLRGR
jgi:TonB family protein